MGGKDPPPLKCLGLQQHGIAEDADAKQQMALHPVGPIGHTSMACDVQVVDAAAAQLSTCNFGRGLPDRAGNVARIQRRIAFIA